MKRFAVFTLREHISLGPATLHPLLRICAWSLNAPSSKASRVSRAMS